MLPVAASAQTSTTTSSTTSSTSTSSTTTVVPQVLAQCSLERCSDTPPAAFLASSNAEVAGEPGGYAWTRPLANGMDTAEISDLFFPGEPSPTLTVVQGGP